MSEIEWSPWIRHEGEECPVKDGGVYVRFADGKSYGPHPANKWHWNEFDNREAQITHYRIPMADYRRIYGEPFSEQSRPEHDAMLDTHPDSELDADQYSVGADTFPEDAKDELLKRAKERNLNPYDAPGFLEAALGHMEDRKATYDAPEGERSMGKTAAMFKVLYEEQLKAGEFSEEMGWSFMVLLKSVRTSQGSFRADNYEDGAAYFALQGEAAARDRGHE